MLDAEPVISLCLARTRFIFLSDTFLCKTAGFCTTDDDVRARSSLELSTDESVAK